MVGGSGERGENGTTAITPTIKTKLKKSIITTISIIQEKNTMPYLKVYY